MEMWSDRPFPAVGELPYLLTFGPHGYYWFRLQRSESSA
jgi:maltose alpha-D-glucosyltransferase/alpha-amylase